MLKVHCDSCHETADSRLADNWATATLYKDNRVAADIIICPDCMDKDYIVLSFHPVKKPVVPFIQPEDPVPTSF